MRPVTLAEACRRSQAGDAFATAIGDFLQAFYLERDLDRRAAMLAAEPLPFADRRFDALVGGMAEWLYKRWAPFRPPPWISGRSRYLDEPFWPVGAGDPALMEYLVYASPGEFKSRNVMTDAAPLRRAVQPPVEPLRPAR